jgi:predicted MFS family arabinose efflux permease
MASDEPALRRDPEWLKYLSAGVLSFAGSRVTEIALPLLVYLITDSPLLTAVVVAAEAVAYLLFGLVAGALADRYDRRRILVLTDVGSALVIGSIPVAAAASGRVTVPHVVLVAMAAAVLSVYNNAADFGALPTLVGPRRVPSAYSVLASAATIVGIVAPAVTGILLGVISPQTVLAIDAVSFVLSAALLSRVRRPMTAAGRGEASTTLRGDILDGLRYLWNHPTIRPITIVGIAQSAFIGATFAQFVPYADRALGIRAGDWRLGSLYVAWTIGALAASVALPRMARRWSAAWITLVMTPIAAVGGLLVALASTWTVAVLLIAVWSTVLAINGNNTVIHRQQEAPERLVSRVSASGRMLAWGIGNPVGAFLGGLAAQQWGPRAAFVLGAGFGVLAAAAAWSSRLRVASREAEPAPAV